MQGRLFSSTFAAILRSKRRRVWVLLAGEGETREACTRCSLPWMGTQEQAGRCNSPVHHPIPSRDGEQTILAASSAPFPFFFFFSSSLALPFSCSRRPEMLHINRIRYASRLVLTSHSDGRRRDGMDSVCQLQLSYIYVSPFMLFAVALLTGGRREGTRRDRYRNLLPPLTLPVMAAWYHGGHFPKTTFPTMTERVKISRTKEEGRVDNAGIPCSSLPSLLSPFPVH